MLLRVVRDRERVVQARGFIISVIGGFIATVLDVLLDVRSKT